MTQAELAKLINVKATIVQEYEAGKAIPTPALVAKFNRALGVTLPKIPKKKVTPEDTKEVLPTTKG